LLRLPDGSPGNLRIYRESGQPGPSGSQPPTSVGWLLVVLPFPLYPMTTSTTFSEDRVREILALLTKAAEGIDNITAE